MQSYTSQFGYMVSDPQIVTTCEVTKQDLAGGKRWLRFLNERLGRRVQTKTVLVMEFTMQYESKFGYDVDEYPREFQAYVNSNLEQVTKDMDSRFLPVLKALEVLVYNTKLPTPSPIGGGLPSMSPSSISEKPSNTPTISPTSSRLPSTAPSAPPVPTFSPTIYVPVKKDRPNFIGGLVAGLCGAAIIVLLLIWYMKRKSDEKEGARVRENAARTRLEEGIELAAEDVPPGRMLHGSTHVDNAHDYANRPPENYTESPSPQGGMGTVADSIFSNPSMVSGGGSFSSDPHGDDILLDPLQDEFDNYKNQDLEIIRNGVEESVYGAEGMMSLAMTRALMEDEGDDFYPMWGGAEDPESIEANALCETYDWLRKNEHSTLDERNEFFQETLNRMVITVRRGMTNPSDGTRVIHSCAAMLGLQLEKDLPNNVLLVHGMRKTADLSLGRSYLVETFSAFGEIEGAAIAPSNRGFGFVRFISPKSVQRALERFRISEIEVQDVSVMIKPLKPEGVL